MSTTTSMTAEQLYMLPDDGLRHELIRGVLTTMAPSGAEHGGVIWDLTLRVARHIDEGGLGRGFGAETGFVLARNPDTVRAADLAFVRNERIPSTGLPRRGFFPGAPDLAIEVLSPGDTVSEVEEKVEEWLTHGAVEVWVVSPRARTVTVHRSATDIRVFTAGEMLESNTLLPGFSCRVSEIFR